LISNLHQLFFMCKLSLAHPLLYTICKWLWWY